MIEIKNKIDNDPNFSNEFKTIVTTVTKADAFTHSKSTDDVEYTITVFNADKATIPQIEMAMERIKEFPRGHEAADYCLAQYTTVHIKSGDGQDISKIVTGIKEAIQEICTMAIHFTKNIKTTLIII